MKKLLFVLFVSLFVACNKKEVVEVPLPDFIKEMETNNCLCEHKIDRRKYKKDYIYHQQLIDPACNGGDIIYDSKGNVLVFSLSDADLYMSLLRNSVFVEKVWHCGG